MSFFPALSLPFLSRFCFPFDDERFDQKIRSLRFFPRCGHPEHAHLQLQWNPEDSLYRLPPGDLPPSPKDFPRRDYFTAGLPGASWHFLKADFVVDRHCPIYSLLP